jgi:hypothetical protein
MSCWTRQTGIVEPVSRDGKLRYGMCRVNSKRFFPAATDLEKAAKQRLKTIFCRLVDFQLSRSTL